MNIKIKLLLITLSMICVLSASYIGSGLFIYYKKESDKKKKKESETINFNIERKNNETIISGNVPNIDKTINIENGPLFRLSYSKGKQFEKTVYEYYTVFSKLLTLDFIIALHTGKLKITNLKNLRDNFEAVDKESSKFGHCMNLSKEEIEELEKKNDSYCIFTYYIGESLDRAMNILNKTIYTKISKKILIEYYKYIKNKIINNKTITLFEYANYLSLYRKYYNNSINYVILCNSTNDIIC